MKHKELWSLVYSIYPPILRLLEKTGLHKEHKDFRIGVVKDISGARAFLENQGFEDAILAWKAKGEVVSMRSIYNGRFQHHIRVFENGVVKGHKEYSPEGNPLGHIFNKYLEPDHDFVTVILKDHLL